jgi:hypothetical protein
MASVVLSYSTPGTRLRPGPVTTNADGMLVPGSETSTPSLGHTFPASGDLIRRFALQDVAGLYETHANIELRTAGPAGSGVLADRWQTTIRGQVRTFEVLRSAPWLEGPTGETTWHVAALQEIAPA